MSAKLSIPKFTVLSDHSEEERFVESVSQLFQFETSLIPMLDILRHKDTVPPLSMALYGGAGTGKSSALQWMMGRLTEWNRSSVAEREGHLRVLPVRIRPYGYKKPERVLNNLIMEVILQCLPLFESQDAAVKAEHLIYVTNCFGTLLGEVFVRRVRELARQWDVESELASSIQQVKGGGEFSALNLKQFLALLDHWGALEERNDPVRIVVMISNLDRCLPEVMTTMLDIIHKQFRSKHVIFLAAMDVQVVQVQVTRSFDSMGYGERQSQNYLSTVFEVETHMSPSEQQVKRFYDQRVAELNRRTDNMFVNHLSEILKGYIDTAILRLAGTNPRKITLVLNSALMRGYSALLQFKKEHESMRDSLLFPQSIQIYLLQHWLSLLPVGESAIFREDVLAWFSLLSEEACNPDSDFSKVEDGTLGKAPTVDQFNRPLRRYGSDEEPVDRLAPPEGLSLEMIPEWVWDLLKIPFNSEVISYDVQEEPEPEPVELEAVLESELGKGELLAQATKPFKEALAGVLEKEPIALTEDDFSRVVVLDLTGLELSAIDLTILGGLDQLERLDLHNNSVQNLAWVSGLNSLKTLNLTCTQIPDIIALETLNNLENLDLSFTQITDLAPLGGLVALKSLVLYGTPVQEIGVLNKLLQLERLNLSHTAVGDDDVTALESLGQLQSVYLQETKLSPARVGRLKQALGFDVKFHV